MSKTVRALKATKSSGFNLFEADGDENDPRIQEYRDKLCALDENGNGLLHYLSYSNNHEEMKKILSNGADPNTVNKYIESALHWAARMGCIGAVQILLDYGANADCQDISGSTPLHYAIENGALEVVPVLIQGGCDVSIADNDGCTAVDIVDEKIEADHTYLATKALLDRSMDWSLISADITLGLSESKADDLRSLKIKAKPTIKKPPAINVEELNAWKKERKQQVEEKKKKQPAPFIAGAIVVSSVPSTPKASTSVKIKSTKHNVSDSLIHDANELNDALMKILDKAVVRSPSPTSSTRDADRSTFGIDSSPVKDSTILVCQDVSPKIANDGHGWWRYSTIRPLPRLRRPGVWTRMVPFCLEKPKRSKDSSKALQTTGKPQLNPPDLAIHSKTHDSVAFSKFSTHATGNGNTEPDHKQKEKEPESHHEAALFVPFVPSGWLTRCLDVYVAVEHCCDCTDHRWFSWHDQDKYEQRANLALSTVLRAIAESGFPVRVFAYKVKSDHTRLAAFEVTVSARVTTNGSIAEDLEYLGGDSFSLSSSCKSPPAAGKTRKERIKFLRGKCWVTHCLHSKLTTKTWPSMKLLRLNAIHFLASIFFGDEFAEVYTGYSSKQKMLKKRAKSPERTTIVASHLKDKQPQQRIAVVMKSWQQLRREALARGDACPKIEGNYNNDGRWLQATIVLERVDGTFDLIYDMGKMEKHVPAKRIRKIEMVSDIDSAFMAYCDEEALEELELTKPEVAQNARKSGKYVPLDGSDEPEPGYDDNECCGGVGQDVMLSFAKWKGKDKNSRSSSPQAFASESESAKNRKLAVLDGLVNAAQKNYLLECVATWEKRMAAASDDYLMFMRMPAMPKRVKTVNSLLEGTPLAGGTTAPKAISESSTQQQPAAEASTALRTAKLPSVLPAYLDFTTPVSSSAPGTVASAAATNKVASTGPVAAPKGKEGEALPLKPSQIAKEALERRSQTPPPHGLSPSKSEKIIVEKEQPEIVIPLVEEGDPPMGFFFDPSSVLFSRILIPGNIRFGPGTMEASLQFAPLPVSKTPFIVTNLRSTHGNALALAQSREPNDLAIDASEIHLPFETTPLTVTEMDTEQIRALYHYFVFDNTPTSDTDFRPPIAVKFVDHSGKDIASFRPLPPKAAVELAEDVDAKKLSSKSPTVGNLEKEIEREEEGEGEDQDEEEEDEEPFNHLLKGDGQHLSSPPHSTPRGQQPFHQPYFGGFGGVDPHHPFAGWGGNQANQYSYSRENMMNVSRSQEWQQFDHDPFPHGSHSQHHHHQQFPGQYQQQGYPRPYPQGQGGYYDASTNQGMTSHENYHYNGPAPYQGQYFSPPVNNGMWRQNYSQDNRDHATGGVDRSPSHGPSVSRQASNSGKNRGRLNSTDTNSVTETRNAASPPQAEEAKHQFAQQRARAFHQALSGKSTQSDKEGSSSPGKLGKAGMKSLSRGTLARTTNDSAGGAVAPRQSVLKGTGNVGRSRQASTLNHSTGTNRPGTGYGPPVAFGRRTVLRPGSGQANKTSGKQSGSSGVSAQTVSTPSNGPPNGTQSPAMGTIQEELDSSSSDVKIPKRASQTAPGAEGGDRQSFLTKRINEDEEQDTPPDLSPPQSPSHRESFDGSENQGSAFRRTTSLERKSQVASTGVADASQDVPQSTVSGGGHRSTIASPGLRSSPLMESKTQRRGGRASEVASSQGQTVESGDRRPRVSASPPRQMRATIAVPTAEG